MNRGAFYVNWSIRFPDPSINGVCVGFSRSHDRRIAPRSYDFLVLAIEAERRVVVLATDGIALMHRMHPPTGSSPE